MCRTPCATSHVTAAVARSSTSCSLRSALRSDHRSMPSNSVPLLFHRGWPAVMAVSRCTCDSTRGGHNRPRRVDGLSGFRLYARVNLDECSVQDADVGQLRSGDGARRALRTIRSSTGISFRPQPCCKNLGTGSTLADGKWIHVQFPRQHLEDSWSAEAALAPAHPGPRTELDAIHRPCANRAVDGSHDITLSHGLTAAHNTPKARVLMNHPALLIRGTVAEQ